jgi:hypothetical protein
MFQLNGRKEKSHHAAYMIFIGPKPQGKDAHHTCLNGSCVNPEHLEWLTRSEHLAEHRRLRAEKNDG